MRRGPEVERPKGRQGPQSSHRVAGLQSSLNRNGRLPRGGLLLRDFCECVFGSPRRDREPAPKGRIPGVDVAYLTDRFCLAPGSIDKGATVFQAPWRIIEGQDPFSTNIAFQPGNGSSHIGPIE